MEKLLETDPLLCSQLEALFEFHDNALQKLEEDYKKNLEKIQNFFKTNAIVDSLTADKTPQQIKKRSKKLSKLNEENSEDSTVTRENESGRSFRHPRAAKKNLDLKEKPLSTKIRRPSNFDPSVTTNIYIKQEKNDSVIDKSGEDKQIPDEPMQVDNNCGSTISENSILILSKRNTVVEIESDVESDKMPPPPVPGTKKRIRKKNISQETVNVEIPRPIKCEKISFNPNEDTNNTTERNQTNSSTSLESTISKTQKKKENKSKFPNPIKIKEEKLSLVDANNDAPQENKKNKKSEKKDRQSNNSNRKGSLESVYEDAMPLTSENIKQFSNMQIEENRPSNNKVNSPHGDILPNDKASKLDKQNLHNEERTSDKNDATFVSAQGLPAAAHNIAVAMAELTLNKSVASTPTDQATFILDNKIHNATLTLKQGEDIIDSNATFEIRTNPIVNLGETYVRDYVVKVNNCEEMEERPKSKYKPKPKSKMEKNQLFNPFIQSPLKTKVEAFEKAAADAGKDASNRLKANNKGKQKEQNDENSEIKNKVVSTLKGSSKNVTPTASRGFGRILTPSQSSSTITPTIGNIIKKAPNSESKAIGLVKSLSTMSKTSFGQQSTRSRENSVEDLKRGYLKLQEISERKKQRDEKQQQALILRQQKEKEREERIKRLIEEREEKKKNAEQKRHLEEIQRNLKLLDEKNEQKRKLEMQKLEKQAAVAAAKKEREILENLKIQKAKEKLQQEYFKNQKLLKNKAKENPLYNFEMLLTEDETDDEDNPSKKRPPLPEWATREVRQKSLLLQAYMPTALVDSFFPVTPLTPDLKEVFPTIDPRYCTRNSSVCWSTPPRYSELPKY
ncbi:inner centromere protein A [Condylostylus longicornis]|uniref:inner centromere protein A n=1 Tax=Condylostylus longicornis TaxID=2530218 RepID=UPI00244D9AE5|nr:inner centromere protein A [Condylostylus longicornis]